MHIGTSTNLRWCVTFMHCFILRNWIPCSCFVHAQFLHYFVIASFFVHVICHGGMLLILFCNKLFANSQMTDKIHMHTHPLKTSQSLCWTVPLQPSLEITPFPTSCHKYFFPSNHQVDDNMFINEAIALRYSKNSAFWTPPFLLPRLFHFHEEEIWWWMCGDMGWSLFGGAHLCKALGVLSIATCDRRVWCF